MLMLIMLVMMILMLIMSMMLVMLILMLMLVMMLLFYPCATELRVISLFSCILTSLKEMLGAISLPEEDDGLELLRIR